MAHSSSFFTQPESGGGNIKLVISASRGEEVSGCGGRKIALSLSFPGRQGKGSDDDDFLIRVIASAARFNLIAF